MTCSDCDRSPERSSDRIEAHHLECPSLHHTAEPLVSTSSNPHGTPSTQTYPTSSHHFLHRNNYLQHLSPLQHLPPLHPRQQPTLHGRGDPVTRLGAVEAERSIGDRRLGHLAARVEQENVEGRVGGVWAGMQGRACERGCQQAREGQGRRGRWAYRERTGQSRTRHGGRFCSGGRESCNRLGGCLSRA